MDAQDFDVDALLKMAHSPVRNYVIPGLTSYLIGMPGPQGTVRLFHNERDHQEVITPHSHRFDFQCWVLRGSVKNRVWKRTYFENKDADKYQTSVLIYNESIGKYTQENSEWDRWKYEDTTYGAGRCYSMKSEEVHSIFFSRGAVVLFFEGPMLSQKSIILEPVVEGIVVPTFKVEPWMFDRGA